MNIVDLEDVTVDGHIPRHGSHGSPKIYPEGMDNTALLEWIASGHQGKPPAGGEYYTRTTTFIDALDDKKLIYDWKTRMTIEGFHRDSSLMGEYEAIEDPFDTEKWKVNNLAEKARVIADSDVRAEEGNVLHSLTETFHNTGDLPHFPPEYEKDIQSYIEAVQGLEMLGVEVFVVNDQYKYAGTADRFIRVTGNMCDRLGVQDGDVICGDLKTGSSVGFSRGKFPMQMAAYSNARLYNQLTFERSPIVFDRSPLREDVGLLIHTPVGEGRTILYKMDLVRGWEDVQLADRVRKYRKHWNSVKSEFEVVHEVQL